MLPPDAANVPLPLAPLGARSSIDGPRPDVEASVKRRVRPSPTTGAPVSKSVTTAVKRLKPAVPGSTASRTLTVVPKSLPLAMSGDATTGGGPLAADAGGATLTSTAVSTRTIPATLTSTEPTRRSPVRFRAAAGTVMKWFAVPSAARTTRSAALAMTRRPKSVPNNASQVPISTMARMTPVTATAARANPAHRENLRAARARSSEVDPRSVRSSAPRPPTQAPTARTWSHWTATWMRGVAPAAAWPFTTSTSMLVAAKPPAAPSGNHRRSLGRRTSTRIANAARNATAIRSAPATPIELPTIVPIEAPASAHWIATTAAVPAAAAAHATTARATTGRGGRS